MVAFGVCHDTLGQEGVRSVVKKPSDLVFGVEERPPFSVAVVVALQHVLAIAVNLVYPLLLAREAGLSTEAAADMLRIGMVALAAGTVLQAIPRGPIGCHYLAPVVYASPYLAPGFLAIKMGGMPLFWGMTIVSGLSLLALAAVWDRLRTLIPPESAGLVVFLVGATIGVAGLRLLHQNDGSIAPSDAWIALLTLAVIIALNIWGKGRLRLFSVLIGLVIGYLVAAASGAIEAGRLQSIASLPLLGLPHVGHMGWSFDATLIIPFAVTALATAMVSTAIVTTYQRITDPDWVRPDMSSISSGIRGDGVSTAIAGLLCSCGVAIAPANAGLVAATGAASRVIAYPIAAILLFAAVVPAFAGLLAVMPPPVMAAGLLFAAAFIMINGVQIISSRMLDARRTIVIGAGVLTFLLVAIFPDTFARAPDWIQSIVSSPLVLATLVALALNLAFRIGIKRSVEMVIERGAGHEGIENFVERNAGGWGARRDVITRAKYALLEAAEAVTDASDPQFPIRLTLTYDEFDITAKLIYRGKPLPLADLPPSADEILTEDGHLLLAGFLLKRQSDRVYSHSQDGQCELQLRFRQ
jgi:NCS2 family nucleobase:cation symporter-2